MKGKKYIFSSFLLFGLGCKTNSTDDKIISRDPSSCKVVDVGEATDFFTRKVGITTDRMITTQGLAHPQALVWRDQQTNLNYYVTRVMGTEQRLFFIKQIKNDERPGIASQFSGHLLGWNELPKTLSAPIVRAFASQYSLKIDTNKTYVILADEKPQGCP
jgi:hypothetical protein